MTAQGPWGPLQPGDGACTSWQVGRCRVWARSTVDEWQIAWELADGDETIPDVECLEDLSWSRFVTVADDRITTVPALPDRPVVVRPASPIVILPGRWGRFFFRVPLWVRFISQPADRPIVMEEIPTKRLTSIWFGSIANGELCYAIEAPLERTLEQLELDDGFAACEITVRNSSRDRLRFERICVHVEHMRLFAAADRLWTNEVRVTFRGSDQVSQLGFQPGPPERAGSVTAIGEPRVPPESGLIKRSFALIREITGI